MGWEKGHIILMHSAVLERTAPNSLRAREDRRAQHTHLRQRVAGHACTWDPRAGKERTVGPKGTFR